MKPSRSGIPIPALAILVLLGVAATTAHAESPVLRVQGMTFVGSRGSISELVLLAERAVFSPDRNIADLEDVHATVDDDRNGHNFTMTCERGELNVATNDFRAEGDVKGQTRDGQRYAAPWVVYEHEKGLLYTDAPVVMVDSTGTFRGNGFRYYVREGRFKLLGHVSVEQSN